MSATLSIAVYAQQYPSQRDSLFKQRKLDPTIQSPPSTPPPTIPSMNQKVDTPAPNKADTMNYRRSRRDSLPVDDRNPNRVPRMKRDSIK